MRKKTETSSNEPAEAAIPKAAPKKPVRSKTVPTEAKPPAPEAPSKPKRAGKAAPEAKSAKPARAAKKAETADPKPAASKPRASKAQAPSEEQGIAVTFRTAKPAALKSLAELVEEEKLQPKPRTPRSAKKASAPAEPAPAPAPEPRAAAPARNRRGRSSERASAPSAESLESLERQVFEEDVVVYWRAQTGAPPRPSRGKAASPVGDEPLAPRRSRGRGRGRTEEVETVSETLEDGIAVSFRRKGEPAKPAARAPRAAAPVEPEPIPAAPTRPRIPIPADAPRIVMRDAVPTLVRDGKVYPPIAFFASAPDERRASTVFAEIRRAAEAGVHIHSILVEFEVDPAAVEASLQYAAYMLAKTIEIDPETQVVFRLAFVTPKSWEARYPNARYLTEAGRTAEPSISDDDYWTVARNCLTDFVKGLRSLEMQAHVLGVHLDRGEWFFPEGAGYDNSPAATAAFRDWLRARYINDSVAFRAAWFDGQVTFNSVQIPEFRASLPGENFMRTSRKERRWVDYHLFLSDATVARIAELAYATKEASEGYYLVGVSYGYTFEWAHPSSGHLSLGKLLRTREIDFVGGPPSYRTREPGGDAPFPCPIDSCTLNGKLYLSEEDYKTAIGEYREPDDYNPVIRTPQALDAVHWRGIGAALAHGSGAFWMDLWGNGWLNTATIWDRGAKARQLLTKRMAASLADPDVAVFIDERALAYLVDQQSFALLVQNVRESVLRSGLSAGFYLLSDLAHRENFPESKLYIFLNAWDIRPEHRLAIKNRLQRDNKVLFWLYCAGMFDNGRESLERAREITGIAIKPQPFYSRTGTTVLNRRHPLCEAFQGQGLIGGAQVDPSYFAIPENATVLGEYSQSGLPSFVIREFNEDPDVAKHWKSVFLGEPVVTPGLLRALAQLAGCHVWNFQGDVVHVRPPFLAIHCTGAGPRAVALPRNWEGYDLLADQWATEDSNAIRFTALDGSTHLFLVGERHEIENILQASPDDSLCMDELPAEPDDTTHYDAMMFDVPIMKLDEFFVETPDEIGEDWFLKPGMLEVEEPGAAPEPEAEEKVGRRRRRRGNGRKSERGAPDTFDDELGMGVMFRKRG